MAQTRPEIGDTLNEAPVAPNDSIAATPVQTEATPPAEDGDGLPVSAIAGVLALLALGAGGAAVMRSRRKARPEELSPSDAVEPQARRERVIPPSAPVVAQATATPAPAPEVTYSYGSAAQTAYAPMAETTYSPVVASATKPRTGRDFAMPEGPVPTGEARQQLLREMVAAAPDKANPFRSPSYRRKRARVILQHRDFLQRQKDDQFDWRTYRPSTRPSTPVKPSLVDA